MSLWKSRRNLFGCARKLCSQTNARRVRTPLSKSREAAAQVRKEFERKGVLAHVPRPLQLRDDVCRGGELRPSRYGVEPLSHLSGLREETRSQEPAVADGISR